MRCFLGIFRCFPLFKARYALNVLPFWTTAGRVTTTGCGIQGKRPQYFIFFSANLTRVISQLYIVDGKDVMSYEMFAMQQNQPFHTVRSGQTDGELGSSESFRLREGFRVRGSGRISPPERPRIVNSAIGSSKGRVVKFFPETRTLNPGTSKQILSSWDARVRDVRVAGQGGPHVG
jgi:hypothetical protein